MVPPPPDLTAEAFELLREGGDRVSELTCGAEAPGTGSLRRPGRRSDLVLGLFGLLVSAAAFWVPSPWIDEAATANIAGRGLSEQTALLSRTDLVYGPYYLLMHFWTGLVGTNPLTLRAPSLLAVGVGTAAMARTGRALGGKRHQLAFAACYALLPRTTAMAVEARPYALSSMCVALVIALLAADRERPRRGRLVLIGAFMTAAVLLQIFAALPLLGILVAAMLHTRARRRPLLVITAVWALVCLPFAIRAAGQRSQISWLGDSRYSLADQGLVEAWFTTRWTVTPSGRALVLHPVATALACLAAAVVAAALVLGDRAQRIALTTALTPALVSTAVLWGASLLGEPVLLGRYLTAAAPCAAACLALGLLGLASRLRAVCAMVLCAGCLLLIGAQRLPDSKVPDQDYSFIASTIHRYSRPGDGLLFENGTSTADSARNAIVCSPGDFSGLIDIAQPQRPALVHVFAVDAPIVELSSVQRLPERIWVVSRTDANGVYPPQLRALGYSPGPASRGAGHTITRWQR